MGTFVSVGNARQPFSRLLDAVARLLPQLPPPVVIQYGHTPFSNSSCEAHPFLDMERFAQEVGKADVLILHAGAGSVLHAILAGKVPVLMPRRACFGEHINDHQVELARQLEGEGLAVVAFEPEDLAKAVVRALSMRAQIAAGRPPPRMLGLVSEVLELRASLKNQ